MAVAVTSATFLMADNSRPRVSLMPRRKRPPARPA
jgi:hypothetical protein